MPDGSRIVTAEGDFALSEFPAQIWVTRLADGVRTAITRDNLNMRPSWAPDGRSVLWTRAGDGPSAIYERPADASGPERLVVSQGVGRYSTAEGRWMPDGRSLLIRTWPEDRGGMNVYRVDPRAPASPIAVLTGPAAELAAVPSPDGALVAFLSDTTGRLELHVQRLDDASKRLQLTTTGGSPARWSRDGRRLSWFSAVGKLVTSTLVTTPALAVTGVEQVTAEVVPETTQRSHAGFDIAADGRVLVAEELRATFETVLVRNALGARAMPR